MQFGKKFLYSLIVVMIFCFITSGGCGGGSDNDNGTEQNQNQSQGNTQNNNNNSTNPNNPTNPNTPNTPNNPTSPDNPSNPTNPTNPTNPETPVGQDGLNGTWEGEKYSGSFYGGYVNYDEQYLDYTSPRTFTITVTKNANDDYYSIVFSGEGVHNSGAVDSYITAVYYTKGAANVDSDNGEAWSPMPFRGAGDKFEKVSDTVYKMTNETISNGESEVEWYTTYTILDNSRAECKYSNQGVVHDDGHDIEMSMDYMVFNIKRVTQ